MNIDRALAAALQGMTRSVGQTDAAACRRLLASQTAGQPARAAGRASVDAPARVRGRSASAALRTARARTREVLLIAQQRLQRVLAMTEIP